MVGPSILCSSGHPAIGKVGPSTLYSSGLPVIGKAGPSTIYSSGHPVIGSEGDDKENHGEYIYDQNKKHLLCDLQTK